jgi:regulator of sigma E protease
MPVAGEWLKEGDVILAIEGIVTPDREAFGTVLGDLPSKATVEYRVLREGQELTVRGPHPFAPVVGEVMIRSAAIDAGLQAGDVIQRAGGQEVTTFAQLPEIIAASKGEAVPLTVWRAGETFDLTLTPRVRTVEDETGAFVERYQIGVVAGLAFEPAMRSTGLWETTTLALGQMWRMTTTTFAGLWHMISGAISSCNLSGAIGMAETMGDAARNGVESFIGMMAVLSLGVGILNLFPIPVLDGGHLVFHAYEAVTRRPPSERALRFLMSVGLTLVIGLMVFGLSRDLTCV